MLGPGLGTATQVGVLSGPGWECGLGSAGGGLGICFFEIWTTLEFWPAFGWDSMWLGLWLGLGLRIGIEKGLELGMLQGLGLGLWLGLELGL